MHCCYFPVKNLHHWRYACLCVLHVLEFIYEELGEVFDLVDIKFGRFLSKGDTLRCIQYEVKVNRTI